MALFPSEIYRFTADKLRQVCSEEGVDSEEPVRVLRQRIMRHLNAGTMASIQDDVNIRTSVSTNLSGETIQVGPHIIDDNSHEVASDGPNSVFVDLMRQVPLFLRKNRKPFYSLLPGWMNYMLSDDRPFVVRILPLVSGAILRIFGAFLRNERSWEQCKSELLREIFPHFVRERTFPRMSRNISTLQRWEKTYSDRTDINQSASGRRRRRTLRCVD